MDGNEEQHDGEQEMEERSADEEQDEEQPEQVKVKQRCVELSCTPYKKENLTIDFFFLLHGCIFLTEVVIKEKNTVLFGTLCGRKYGRTE